MICKTCSQEAEPHKQSNDTCDACYKANANRVMYLRNNHNWMDIAVDAGIELYERQPQETDHEWSVWLKFRGQYPGKRPVYKEVAEELGLTHSAVKNIAQRWDFTLRMQAWAKHVDELALQQHEKDIIEMNKQHVDMAARLNAKISKAIDMLQVETLTPRELNSLMKTATELEKKARVDQIVPTNRLNDENPELNKKEVKTSDIEEIVKILSKAGKLGNFGVRQTTTEVVVKD